MFNLKFVSLIIFVAYIECQEPLNGPKNPIDRLPGVTECDMIVAQGVENCADNYLPESVPASLMKDSKDVSNNDLCCPFIKYIKCVNRLHAELDTAMEREKCSKTNSTLLIKSIGDSAVGLPLKSLCGNGEGEGLKCPKGSPFKLKKNQKTSAKIRRRPNKSGSYRWRGRGYGYYRRPRYHWGYYKRPGWHWRYRKYPRYYHRYHRYPTLANSWWARPRKEA